MLDTAIADAPPAGATTLAEHPRGLRAGVPAAERARAHWHLDASADDRPACDLEIIVPAYNEAARLPATLAALQDHLRALPLDTAIVVVDNGSVDATAGVVRRLPDDVPVYVLGCADQGKGAAVRRGVLTSRATLVGFQDADLSTPLSALRPVLECLADGADGADVAIAVRRGDGADDGVRTGLRKLGSAAFASMARSLTQVEDSQCGFKFFRTDAAHEIFGRARIDGFAFDVEILALARRCGLTVREVPVAWTAAEGSTFRPLQDGLRSFVEVARVRRSLARTA